MKNVIVTGGTGFIGSWLLQELLTYGIKFMVGATTNKLINYMVLSACILSAIMLMQLLDVKAVSSFLGNNATATFYNENHFAYFLCVSVLLSAGKFLYEHKKMLKIWYIVAFLFLYGRCYHYTPAVSEESSKLFRAKIKDKIYKKPTPDIVALAKLPNSIIRVWKNYFGRFSSNEAFK